MRAYPRFMRRHEYGWYILFFRLWHFEFRWFTDCGEWFIYICWAGNKAERVVRLSSAGFYCEKYERKV